MRLTRNTRGLAIAGLIVALVTGPIVYEATVAPVETLQTAEAHAGDAETIVTCDKPNSQYKAQGDVEWTNVPNGVTGTVYIRVGTSTFQNWSNFGSFNDWTVLGVTSGASGKLTYDYTLPGTTTSAPWYYIWIDWSDGYTQQRKFDDRAENLAGDCVTTNTPDADFTVDTEPATCTTGESLNAPVGTNVVFDPTNTPTGTTGPAPWTVKGDATATHTFSNGDLSKTLSGTLAGPLDPNDPACRKPATPVSPTVLQGKCVAGKVVPGSAPTFAELVALQPLGVVATLNAGSTTDGTFSAANGYYLTTGSATTFSLKLDPDPTAATCAPPCTQHCNTPPQPFTGDEVHAESWLQAQVNAALPWVVGGLVSIALILFVVFWRPIMTTVRKLRRPRVTG